MVVSDHILGRGAALTTARVEQGAGRRGRAGPRCQGSSHRQPGLIDGKKSFIPLPSTQTQARRIRGCVCSKC